MSSDAEHLTEEYHNLPTRDLLRRISESPPDTPDWIKSKAEIDRRAATRETELAPLREREFVDSITDVTRNERKLLLIFSAVLIAVVHGDLVPTKIEALGIELELHAQRALLLVAAAIDFYLLTTFWIYARSDLRAWREDQILLAREKARHVSQRFTALDRGSDVSPSELQVMKDVAEEMTLQNWPRQRLIYVVRSYFDCWAPIAVAGYAIMMAILHVIQSVAAGATLR